ncbi:MAG: hypothetical protein ACYSUQ_05315 [Planctomycetota bacterium]
MTSEGPSIVNRQSSIVLLVGAAVVIGLIAAKNPFVLVLLLTDGFTAACVLCPATLGGLALLPLLRLGALPWRWQLLLGAGLGLGLLAILVLLLGLAGLLHRPVWIVILVVSAVAGIARLYLWPGRIEVDEPAPAAGQLRWLWLLVCPFLALTILVAAVPPGYLWAEEGNGYDVLEYHLQMPKEYLAAGRISYAPHNVYASFPANVEMLYLLCMVLEGDAIDAAGACKMLNAALAILTVGAAWLIGRQRSPAAGIVTGVVTAGIGWLTYLSGVAYVENGMLLFGMLSMGTLIRAIDDPTRPLRWLALSGLLAGFSLGCKYTAAGLIGLPLTVALLFTLRLGAAGRLAAVGLFLCAQAGAFAPWAIKNAAMTRNPAFPLAGHLFTHDPPGWGRAESEHFAAAHAPGEDERGITARLAGCWRHIPADRAQRFGPLLLVLAAWGSLAARRDRVVRACWLVLIVQVAVWIFATHLYARFAVPMLMPLVVFAGGVTMQYRLRRRMLVVLLIVGTLGNLAFLGRVYVQHMWPQGERFDLEGATGVFTAGLGLGHEHLAVINHDLPNDARILMIGDAKAFYFRRHVDYCVVFNRNPFVEMLRTAQPDARGIVAWLADRGYSHVLVNWAEIRRLRSSRYGFPDAATPELFHRLAGAGLTRTQAFTSGAAPPGATPYAELYRVAPAR